jgi:DNA-binding NtrC family response regulator
MTQSSSAKETQREEKMLGRVLILCPEDENRNKIVATVCRCGLDPLSSSNYREARELLRLHNFAAVFCSDTIEDAAYPQIIEAAKPVPVIVLSRFAEWDPCLAALAAGAFDYIPYPPDHREVERILLSAIRQYLPIKSLTATGT